MHIGIADHLGWAIAVSVSGPGEVLDRRRIALLNTDLPARRSITWAVRGPSTARRSATTPSWRPWWHQSAHRPYISAASLDDLADDLPSPITSLGLRAIRTDVSDDIGQLRRAPWESRADAIMYRRVLAEIADIRGWTVHFYGPKTVHRLAFARLEGGSAAALDAPPHQTRTALDSRPPHRLRRRGTCDDQQRLTGQRPATEIEVATPSEEH